MDTINFVFEGAMNFIFAHPWLSLLIFGIFLSEWKKAENMNLLNKRLKESKQ